MSGKDENVFSKEALMTTDAGKKIAKQALLRGKGYRQFQHQKERAESEFPRFVDRFVKALHVEIKGDPDPASTLSAFLEEVGAQELLLDSSRIEGVRARLSTVDTLTDRVGRILNSNYVKMTYPVFNALFDGANSYLRLNATQELRDALIDGHVIAIDLSEPMDRIVDQDEDLEYLDDYRLMNPYILKIARKKIASAGDDAVLRSFEEGFKDARIGQYIDHKLKQEPFSISDEKMMECYKKYRAVMGTAGKNMAMARKPLGDIFYHGMARAGESVGCGNEIEDSLRTGAIKIPSWPLYYALSTQDVGKAFELTIRKSDLFLDDARIALEMLPDEFETKHFLEFLFLTVRHYNQFWYNQLEKEKGRYDGFKEKLGAMIRS